MVSESGTPTMGPAGVTRGTGGNPGTAMGPTGTTDLSPHHLDEMPIKAETTIEIPQ